MPQSMAEQLLRAVLEQLTRKTALQKVSEACQICIQVFVSYNNKGLLARLCSAQHPLLHAIIMIVIERSLGNCP